MLLSDEREALAAAGRRLAGAGLVTGTSGNLSARRGNLVAVTPTGGVIGELTPSMMPVIDLDGQLVEGEFAPTSEVPMHLAVYQATGAGAIAHTHAVMSTAIACTLTEIPLVHYMMLNLGGEIRVAPYATYGTEELARYVTEALRDRRAALLQNHGSIAIGETIELATGNLELTEWCAELYARCLAFSQRPRVLTADEIRAVNDRLRKTGYGTMKKLP